MSQEKQPPDSPKLLHLRSLLIRIWFPIHNSQIRDISKGATVATTHFPAICTEANSETDLNLKYMGPDPQLMETV